MRSAFRAAAVPAAALLAALALAGCAAASRPGAADTVAWVDDLPVAAGELRREMAALRGRVMARFRDKGGVAEFGAEFWNSRIEGERPIDALRREALRSVARIMVERAAAVKAGLLADASYEGFLAGLSAENARRAGAVAAGTTIYGPERFDEIAWADWSRSQALLGLRRAIAGGPRPGTEELRALYAEERARLEGEGIECPSFAEMQGLLVTLRAERELERELASREAAARIRIREPAFGAITIAD